MSGRSAWLRRPVLGGLVTFGVLIIVSAFGPFGPPSTPVSPEDGVASMLGVVDGVAARPQAGAPAPVAAPGTGATPESLRKGVNREPQAPVVAPPPSVPETPQLASAVTTSRWDGVDYVRLYVPYINQVYDTNNAFAGECACGPTSLAMVLAYYGRVGARDMEVSVPYAHNSPYGWAITDSAYRYGDVVFDRQVQECEDGPDSFGGLYGALMVSDQWTMTEWWRLEAALTAHGLSYRGLEGDELTPDAVRAAIDQGHPVILTQRGLTGVGHLIVITGYRSDGYLLVNDSWGYKWGGYPNYDGADVPYTWDDFGAIGKAWEVFGAGEGWRAEYYDSTGTPYGRYDRDINFNWGVQSPGAPFEAYSFTARWTRVLTLDAGTYTWSMTSDGDSQVFVDGKLVIDQADQGGGVQTLSATQELPAGQHEVVVTYRHNPGDPAVARFGLSR